MTKKTVTIIAHEDKTSKNNLDYTRFKCEYADGKDDSKWMSAFDKDLIKNLKEHENKLINVEIEQKDNFFNIKKFYGVTNEVFESEDDDVHEDLKPKEGTGVMRENPGTSFYTSYAKDIFCELIKNDKIRVNTEDQEEDIAMDIAIRLVKQARKAFS